MHHKNSDSNRAVRLSQIQHFLHKNSEGLTTKDLSGFCDATIRTIQRDLLILQSDLHVPIINKGHDRYGILVFPTHVGVNRYYSTAMVRSLGIPHVCGGEPLLLDAELALDYDPRIGVMFSALACKILATVG